MDQGVSTITDQRYNLVRITSRRSRSLLQRSSRWSCTLEAGVISRSWDSCRARSEEVRTGELINVDTFYVMDSFPLPVVGTETRVNAGSEANEFMAQHIEACESV